MDNNATTTTENVTPLMEDDGTVIEHVDENGHTVKVENTDASHVEETATDTSTADSKQSENTQETEVKKDESTENESTPTTDSNTEKVEETVSETTHESTNETVASPSTTENETVTQTPSSEETTTLTDEDVKVTDEVKEEVETHPYVSFGVPSPEKVDIFIKRIKKANLLSELKKTEDGEYILGPYNSLEEAYQARKQIIRKGLRGKIIEF